MTALPGLLAALTIWLASAAIVEAQATKPRLLGSPSLGEVQGQSSRIEDRAFSSGLALGAVLGSEAPMFGGVALYYLQLVNPRLRAAVHLGAGGAPRLLVTRAWSLVGGAFLAYGKHHRLVAGVSAGTQTWEQYSLYGARLASRPLWGAALGVGYEWMSRFGLFLRTSVGPSFYVKPERPLAARTVHPSFQAGLTLGYKIW